jgi:hypothetical protein
MFLPQLQSLVQGEACLFLGIPMKVIGIPIWSAKRAITGRRCRLLVCWWLTGEAAEQAQALNAFDVHTHFRPT